jgi:hypothetical protein
MRTSTSVIGTVGPPQRVWAAERKIDDGARKAKCRNNVSV